MFTFLLILSITLSYFSFQSLTILKNKLERHNHLLPPTFQQGLNYESKVVFLPVLSHFVIPTLALYLLFDGSSLWQLLLFLVVHFLFYYFIGARIINFILMSLNVQFIRPERKVMMLSLALSVSSIIFLIFAYAILR